MTLVKRYRASFCTILAALFSAVTNCTAMPQTQAAAEPPAEEPAAAVVEERAEERSDEVQGLYREEAEYAARVIYGTARNHSKDDQRLVVWCIINRVECSRYPDSVKEVCRQSQQWMGHSDNNPVLKSLYKLALQEIKTWHSGAERSVPSKYVYLVWSSDDIVLKKLFEDSEQTRYWRT